MHRVYISEQDRKKSRASSYYYHVLLEDKKVQVCKLTFKAIFDVSDGRIARAMKQLEENSGMIFGDGRGKATSQRVGNDARQRVRDHIESFPKDHSHYSRESNPNVQFLSMDLKYQEDVRVVHAEVRRGWSHASEGVLLQIDLQRGIQPEIPKAEE